MSPSTFEPLSHIRSSDFPLLDEIDYGVYVVDRDRSLLHANRVGWTRLRQQRALSLSDDTLVGHTPEDTSALERAVQAAAQRGLRRLITIGRGLSGVGVAVVPLPAQGQPSTQVLLIVSRDHVCEPLTAEWYARSHGLTLAEARVLQALCSGYRPNDIATQLRVAPSTIRTHICTIRAKTGVSSIRDLVQNVAQLPPMVNALSH